MMRLDNLLTIKQGAITGYNKVRNHLQLEREKNVP